jgi:hypothetical protein
MHRLKKVKTYIFFLLFSFIWIHGYSQNTNPFEIEERLDSIQLIFGTNSDIDNGNDSLPLNNIIAKEADETKPSEVQDSIKTESKTEINTSEGNPFEVSHIPLRSSELKKQEKQLEPVVAEENEGSSFPFWLILFSCALLAIVISLNRSILGDIRRSILNDNTMRLLQRQEDGGTSFILIILYLSFFINAALFVMMSLKLYGVSSLPSFLYIILGIFSVYIIRHISLYIIGKGFPVEKESSQFNFAIVLYNILIGIILIPINLLLGYGPESLNKPMIIFGIVLIIIIYGLRQLRGLFISYRFVNYYKFHFFLYLCTCEIAPLFILVKILTKQF